MYFRIQLMCFYFIQISPDVLPETLYLFSWAGKNSYCTPKSAILSHPHLIDANKLIVWNLFFLQNLTNMFLQFLLIDISNRKWWLGWYISGRFDILFLSGFLLCVGGGKIFIYFIICNIALIVLMSDWTLIAKNCLINNSSHIAYYICFWSFCFLLMI